MNYDFKEAKLEEIARAIQRFDNFLICGHVNPDVDCVGSQVALSFALVQLGKNVKNLLADKSKFDDNLRFLTTSKHESFDFYKAEDLLCDKNFMKRFKDYCFVSVDVQSELRLGNNVVKLKKNASFSVVIDHHQPETLNSNLEYINPKAASNTLNIWEFCNCLDIEINKEIAQAVYAGLSGDTNSFTNSNTDIYTLQTAANLLKYGIDAGDIAKRLYQSRSLSSLKLEKIVLDNMHIDKENKFVLSYLTPHDYESCDGMDEDSDKFINLLRELEIVDVACILKQKNPSHAIKGSLRSKSDVDVSMLAGSYMGGGHKAAAGFTMNEYDMDKALKNVSLRLVQLMQGNL